jgi:hypothetical protein
MIDEPPEPFLMTPQQHGQWAANARKRNRPDLASEADGSAGLIKEEYETQAGRTEASTARSPGIAIAAAFLVFGVTRVLPEPAPVTLGARIVLFPGAVALWPYVLIRWLRSSR